MILNERSQSEKVIYCMIPTIWHSVKDKTMEPVKRVSGYQELWGRGEWIGGALRISG